MMRGLVLPTLGLFVAFLAGCYAGPGTADRSSSRNPGTLPIGVNSGGATGIYQKYPIWANGCCWLADTATFATTLPARTSEVLLRLAIPDTTSGLNEAGQAVSVAVDDAAPQTFRHLRPGVVDLTVQVPPITRARTVKLRLKMSVSFPFGPADPRPRSLLLVRVSPIDRT